jgi:uncharacterized protein
MLEWFSHPLPWFVAGPLIGLTVPVLMLLGNKPFGISSNLRHVCAIVLPRRLRPSFLRHDWYAERWNLVFALGMLLGGFIAGIVFADRNPAAISDATRASLELIGVTLEPGMLPAVFQRFDLKSLTLLAAGGFLVGFGSRYAGGCTSGHAITGLATWQWPSLVAVLSFFVSGAFSAQVLLPLLLGS